MSTGEQTACGEKGIKPSPSHCGHLSLSLEVGCTLISVASLHGEAMEEML